MLDIVTFLICLTMFIVGHYVQLWGEKTLAVEIFKRSCIQPASQLLPIELHVKCELAVVKADEIKFKFEGIPFNESTKETTK